jgi:broad specificity phosphatase PhoE
MYSQKVIRLVMVRHGETDWNAQHRYQGHADIALSARGRKQVEAAARKLASESFDAIWSSDLARAWETAQAIASAGSHEVQPEPRLREMAFGVFDGLTHEQVMARHADVFDAWFADGEKPPPGGEKASAFEARIGAFFGEIRSSDTLSAVLIVAHSGTLRELIRMALDLPPGAQWRFRMDNASISEIHVYEEGCVLHRLNAVDHLEAI